MTGTATWRNQAGTQQYVQLGTAVANENKLYFPVGFQNGFVINGRVRIPEDGVGTQDSVAVAIKNELTEYGASLRYGTESERNSIAITRNGHTGSSYLVDLPPGWYSLKVVVDYTNNSISMKAWHDGESEPALWQAQHSLGEDWIANAVGFQHYGQGAYVDDLTAMELPPIPKLPRSLYLPSMVR